MRRPHPSLPHPWAETPDPDAETLPDWQADPAPPVIWSVAGTDSGGGAGLSADTRAAPLLGVHLCPVVAAVTAQNSCGVRSVHAQPAELLSAQFAALEQDLTPRAIKTGLLGSVEAVRALVAVLERLRQRAPTAPVALVVDPVLGASAGGAAFADAALLQAYRELLLPRCDLLTPNRREAERLCGVAPGALSVPALAERLRALGARAVCITGGDDLQTPGADRLALDWLSGRGAEPSGQAPAAPAVEGWLALPRLRAEGLHQHGSGCTFATAAAAALARGFALADAVILAKMLAWCGLRDGHAAGAGPGPLRPRAGFIDDPAAMPVLGSALDARPSAATLARWASVLRQPAAPPTQAGALYGISADPAQLARLARGGRFAHLQLRIKGGADEAHDRRRLQDAIAAAVQGCRGQGVQLWINDHWELALRAGAEALHLGQEDWARLGPAAQEELLALQAEGRLRLGLSSHSLWELARARALAPALIACGPIWPTQTKDMPWLPQGLAQLRWWVRMAGRPVVAIGGVTDAARLAAARRSGAAAVCLVRGLALAESAPPQG